MTRKRTAILISGRGTNMRALVEAAADDAFPAEITLVLSNSPDAAGLAFAKAANVATAVVDHATYGKDREAFEHALQAALDAHGIEILCLAGFMRLLTPWFVSRWEGRMLNIHPALLPAFKGLDTHHRALETGVKIHGATVHFVGVEMDSGPIVAQGALAVNANDIEETLAARVLAVEHAIYPAALAMVARGDVTIDGAHCVIANARDTQATLVVPPVKA
jgi:phosphoribosylglycinamide formyltransferase-1